MRTKVQTRKINVTPVTANNCTLEALLAGITQDNIHKEVDTGSPKHENS